MVYRSEGFQKGNIPFCRLGGLGNPLERVPNGSLYCRVRGDSANKEIEQYLKKRVAQFEKENGKIQIDEK